MNNYSEFNNIVGVYYGFYYRNNGEIEKNIIELFENGEVTVSSTNEKYEGKSYYNSGNIYIELFSPLNKRKALYIFYTGYSLNSPEIAGIYASTSINGKPVVGTILLCSNPELKNMPDIIKIHDQNYKKLNSDFKNIGKKLIGKTSNYIKSIPKNDFTFLENEFEIDDVLFSAACHYAYEGKFEKSAELIERAFFHGFFDLERVAKLRSRYSNMKVLTNKIDLLYFDKVV